MATRAVETVSRYTQPGQNNVYQFSTKTEVPESMKWKVIKTSVIGKNERHKIRSVQGDYSSNGTNVVRFKLPDSAFLDFKHAKLKMTVRVSQPGGGGTFTRIHNGIWSIFDRVRLYGGGEIEDIRDWNLWMNEMWEMGRKHDLAETVGSALYGVGSQLQRNAWAAGREYFMPLKTGVFSEGLLPLPLISEKMELELYIANPSTFIESDATGPFAIEILDPILECRRIRPDSSYVSAVRAKIQNNQFHLHFYTPEHYLNNITTTNNADIQINHRSDSLLGLVTVFRNGSQLNDVTVNNRLSTYNFPGLLEHQLKINGEFHPDEPIAGLVEFYEDYLHWIDGCHENLQYHDITVVDETEFTSNKFFQVNDLDIHPRARKHIGDSDYVNPVGTSGNAADILIRMRFAAPVTFQLDTFAYQAHVIQITSHGNIKRFF